MIIRDTEQFTLTIGTGFKSLAGLRVDIRSSDPHDKNPAPVARITRIWIEDGQAKLNVVGNRGGLAEISIVFDCDVDEKLAEMEVNVLSTAPLKTVIIKRIAAHWWVFRNGVRLNRRGLAKKKLAVAWAYCNVDDIGSAPFKRIAPRVYEAKP